MRQRDENKIQAISEKAVEMIAGEGLENFGINKLARAAGVSPATIYIYYKDKDDFLNQLSVEEGKRLTDATTNGLEPEMSFEEGLWIQWKNRANYAMKHKLNVSCAEKLLNSNYREKMQAVITAEMKRRSGPFLKNAVAKGEINEMPIEIFWAIAFSPLYTLLRFHESGHSLGGNKFTLTQKTMRDTFEYVIKALKK